MTTPRRVPKDRKAGRGQDTYVLIAMPNANRATAFRAAITAGTFDTVVVRDGEEARQTLTDRGAPMLLILDLSLPRVDGFELLRELRQRATAGESGAIVVSGHSAVRAAARRLSDTLGISRVLPFDVDRPALREAVDATLNDLSVAGRVSLMLPPTGGAERTELQADVDDAIDSAVIAAARRFRTAVTVVYAKIGQHEHVRGWFALGDADAGVNATQSLAFLRQVAAGTDALIVPNVAKHPALNDFAPSGMPLIRGFAAMPLSSAGDLTGALCILDTRPLQIGAADLDTLDALARDLAKDLGVKETASVTDTEVSTKVTPVDIDSLERLASADPLTGLANRRGGEKDIAAEISRARRQNTPLSCVLLDLDHFKEVNDTFGHQAGDYVLREVSALLRRTVRAYDILVRWGGEEFLVVLPGVEKDQALRLAERIRQAVENMPLAGIGGVTASVGVAALGSDYSFDAMFAAADRRLYSAKAAGRNTVA